MTRRNRPSPHQLEFSEIARQALLFLARLVVRDDISNIGFHRNHRRDDHPRRRNRFAEDAGSGVHRHLRCRRATPSRGKSTPRSDASDGRHPISPWRSSPRRAKSFLQIDDLVSLEGDDSE